MSGITVQTLDEVDPHQLQLLTYHCFGAPLGSQNLQRARKLDTRCLDPVGLYAVEGGQVVGQALLLKLDIETPSGPTAVAGLWGVCTHPGASRRGVASQLIAAAHRTFRDVGLDLVLLNTWRSWVAHELYRRLGYREVLQLPVAERPTTAGPQGDAGATLSVQEPPPEPWPSLFWVYRQQAQGCLGFIHRDRDLYAALECWGLLGEPEVKVVRGAVAGGGPEDLVGYAIARQHAGGTVVREVAALPGQLPGVLGALERQLSTPHLLLPMVTHRGCAAALQAAGWKVSPSSWMVLMAVDLTRPWLEAQPLQQRLGTDSDRFLYSGLDLF